MSPASLRTDILQVLNQITALCSTADPPLQYTWSLLLGTWSMSTLHQLSSFLTTFSSCLLFLNSHCWKHELTFCCNLQYWDLVSTMQCIRFWSMWPWWQVTMWGHTAAMAHKQSRHTLILTTLVIFVTTGTTLNQACGYNQICSCQIQNSSESVIFTGIQTHCSAVCCGGTWIGDTNHTPGLYPQHHAALQQ